MGAVVEGDSAPAVRVVLDVKVEARVVVVLVEGVETIVVARGAVGDIPWCGGVVELVGVANAVVHGGKALVDVGMARVDEVDAIFDQEGLKDFLATPADGAGFVLGAKVPRAVAS
jgi:hypothetical protein